MIRIFVIDDNYPLCIKTIFNREKNCFMEIRSTWSRSFQFEKDTLYYSINRNLISDFHNPISIWQSLPFVNGEYHSYWDNPGGGQHFHAWEIQDSTFSIGKLDYIQYFQYPTYGRPQTGSFLEKLWIGWAHDIVFSPEIGYIWAKTIGTVRGSDGEYAHKYDLIYYINPMDSPEAELVRRDLR